VREVATQNAPMTTITELDIVALATRASALRRRAACGDTTVRLAARVLEIELQRRLGEPVPTQPDWQVESLEASCPVTSYCLPVAGHAAGVPAPGFRKVPLVA
jgi:hypothetical protein